MKKSIFKIAFLIAAAFAASTPIFSIAATDACYTYAKREWFNNNVRIRASTTIEKINAKPDWKEKSKEIDINEGKKVFSYLEIDSETRKSLQELVEKKVYPNSNPSQTDFYVERDCFLTEEGAQWKKQHDMELTDRVYGRSEQIENRLIKTEWAPPFEVAQKTPATKASEPKAGGPAVSKIPAAENKEKKGQSIQKITLTARPDPSELTAEQKAAQDKNIADRKRQEASKADEAAKKKADEKAAEKVALDKRRQACLAPDMRGTCACAEFAPRKTNTTNACTK